MPTTPVVHEHDRLVLRELAARVNEIAMLDEMRARRERWVQHNALRGERPLILCFPEGAWEEILPPRSSCKCQDAKLQHWELALRRKLFWWDHIRDDAAIEPFFDINWQITASNYGVEVPMHWGDNRGSYVWDPPIKDLEADFCKLRPRTFSVDRAATQRDLDLATSIFGDLLPARIRGRPWWTTGLTQSLAYMVGIECLMLAMMDQPVALHRLMQFLQQDMLHYMEWVEAEGLMTPHNEADYVGSGGLGYSRELGNGTGSGRVTLADTWGFGESQETVGVSPMMFADFIMPYQAPLLERFGLNCYGCCEGLEHRIDVVLRNVPRLRRVSVAPKANQEILARKLGRRCIFSRKADPIPVCLNADESVIRADLRHTLEVAGELPLEIILKDTHTVQGEAARLTRWVRLAREEVDRYVGGNQ